MGTRSTINTWLIAHFRAHHLQHTEKRVNTRRRHHREEQAGKSLAGAERKQSIYRGLKKKKKEEQERESDIRKPESYCSLLLCRQDLAVTTLPSSSARNWTVGKISYLVLYLCTKSRQRFVCSALRFL